MKVTGKSVLVTGANRGLGQALVEEALKRGVKRVYAAARGPLEHSDERVISLTLDVTNAEQVKQAAEKVKSLDVLVSNAGVAIYTDLSDRDGLEQQLAVNLFGLYNVSQAFQPLLARSQGAMVNVLSLSGLAATPFSATYSISKAAAFSLTQSLRALWAKQGVNVHAVHPGPMDTDMTRGLDLPKASPESAASAIFDGVEKGDEDIFPDLMSQSYAESWRTGGKTLERQFAAFMPPEEPAVS